MAEQKLEYDAEYALTYGYYNCPECYAKFFRLGSALHNRGCSQTDYSRSIYYFGPKQVEKVKDAAEKGDESSKWEGISLQVLQEQFPSLL